MGPQVAAVWTASNDQKISTSPNHSFAQDLGQLATANEEVGVQSQPISELGESLLSGPHQHVPKMGVDVSPARPPLLNPSCDVGQGQLCLEPGSQVSRPADGPVMVGLEVNGADHASDGKCRVGGQLRMGIGPDRTLAAVLHLAGHRTQEERAAARGHQDEVGLLLLGRVHDHACRIPGNDPTADRNALQVRTLRGG
jgi:hypothetical protein